MIRWSRCASVGLLVSKLNANREAVHARKFGRQGSPNIKHHDMLVRTRYSCSSTRLDNNQKGTDCPFFFFSLWGAQKPEAYELGPDRRCLCCRIVNIFYFLIYLSIFFFLLIRIL